MIVDKEFLDIKFKIDLIVWKWDWLHAINQKNLRLK